MPLGHRIIIACVFGVLLLTLPLMCMDLRALGPLVARNAQGRPQPVGIEFTEGRRLQFRIPLSRKLPEQELQARIRIEDEERTVLYERDRQVDFGLDRESLVADSRLPPGVDSRDDLTGYEIEITFSKASEQPGGPATLLLSLRGTVAADGRSLTEVVDQLEGGEASEAEPRAAGD